jgi:ribosomal protein L37AE/L43A
MGYVSMKVLAIDPGNMESGFVIWDGKTISEKGIVTNPDMINIVQSSYADIVLLEMIACYGMAVGQSVFDTCRFVGKLELTCDLCKKPYKLVYRKDVKLWHCNTTRAGDANIAQRLKDKYGDKGTKQYPGITYGIKSHMWQAFAIATMHTEQLHISQDCNIYVST